MESATLVPVRPELPLQPWHASCRGRFSTGIEQLPDAPSKQRVGRFCDGIAQAGDAEARVGRFRTGIEGGETPSMLRRGSFADGYERILRR